MGRVFVLGGQAPHGDEPGEDDRLNRSLGPAREHRVRVASFDQFGRLTYSMRTGGAGRHGRVIGPADPERDRELPARRIDEHARDEAR